MRNKVKIKYYTFLNRVKENFENSDSDHMLKKMTPEDINLYNINIIKLVDEFLGANEFSIYELQDFFETDCLGLPLSFINDNMDLNLNNDKNLGLPVGQVVSSIFHNATRKSMILQLVDLLRDLYYEREKLILN